MKERQVRTLDQILSDVENGTIGAGQALSLMRESKFFTSCPSNNKSHAQNAPDALHELEDLIGLDEVKRLVLEIRAFAEIRRRRLEKGLAADPLVLHMIFKGNPGTGKTTVARVMGKIFMQMGILSKGHLVEVERADLVGEYIGHTAQKTREQIKKALGGILFIDEAYSLARGGEKDFGKEAIDTLVKAMEDHKDELVLVLAGYQEEMTKFLLTNPGLRSRFPIHIDFPDYSLEELMRIAELMLSQREYRLTTGAREKLKKILADKRKTHEAETGNARLVRNIIEKTIRHQAVRLLAAHNLSKEDLMMITEEDLEGDGEE
ncbi:MAG: stage V sporulation protein K [Bacillota bacterium]